MSTFTPEPIILKLFHRLRLAGFSLSINEYLGALDALAGGFGANSLEGLRQMLRLLWCHSLAEQSQFELIFNELPSEEELVEVEPLVNQSLPIDRPPLNISPTPIEQFLPPETSNPIPPKVSHPEPELTTLPVRSPVVPVDMDNLPELYSYHPLSRRSMSYCWRDLSRWIANGAADLLDVPTTVNKSAKQGFFIAPVYQRRSVNTAKVLILIDQGGSMTPFHRFTRDFTETALLPGVFPEEHVQVGYFYNFPTDYVYRDAHLTAPRLTAQLLAECDQNTSVLIVSDGGAARGYRRMERIRKTTEFLVQLKRQTSLISWLNPMPSDRWQGSSAEILAYLVPMEQMNKDGLSNAIDVVRGRSLKGQAAPYRQWGAA
jgi:uncharacterized protein